MKEAILHIGTEKTGTSTIQNFLSRYRDQLLRNHNYLYPQSIGKINHQRLCLIAAPKSIRTQRMRLKFGLLDEDNIKIYRRNIIREFKEEIENSNSPNLLMSSEHFSSRLCTLDEIRSLKEILDDLGYQSKVMIYFRRQDDLIPSEFSTSIKVGNVVSLDPQKHNFWYNYHTVCENWSQVFGKENLICRAFQKIDFHNGSLIDDFLQSIGINMKVSKAFNKKVNHSLDGRLLQFLKEFNKRVPFNQGNKVNQNRGNIARLLHQYQESKQSFQKVAFSSQEKALVLKRYQVQNELLAKEYGVQLQLDINPQSSSELEPLSMDEMYDVFTYLWSTKQNEINLLKKTREVLK